MHMWMGMYFSVIFVNFGLQISQIILFYLILNL